MDVSNESPSNFVIKMSASCGPSGDTISAVYLVVNVIVEFKLDMACTKEQ